MNINIVMSNDIPKPPPCKMTSERLFDVIRQPDDTCPMLDAIKDYTDNVIGNLTSALRDMYRSRGTAEEQLQELISEVETTIRWLEEVDVEKVRANVELIREWGQQWKSIAKRELLK